MNDNDFRACECYKAFYFTEAVKAGIDTDIAREIAATAATAWLAGYYYAKKQYGTSPED